MFSVRAYSEAKRGTRTFLFQLCCVLAVWAVFFTRMKDDQETLDSTKLVSQAYYELRHDPDPEQALINARVIFMFWGKHVVQVDSSEIYLLVSNAFLKRAKARFDSLKQFKSDSVLALKFGELGAWSLIFGMQEDLRIAGYTDKLFGTQQQFAAYLRQVFPDSATPLPRSPEPKIQVQQNLPGVVRQISLGPPENNTSGSIPRTSGMLPLLFPDLLTGRVWCFLLQFLGN